MLARSQFRALYREFLFRIVDRELLSAHAQGDASKLLLQLASLLIFLSVLFSIAAIGIESDLLPQIRLIQAWSTEHFLIATTMLVVGLFAVLSWNSIFPDRRDVFLLAPLPVGVRTVFLAKLAAIATALGLTVLTLHMVAGLVWPLALNVRASPFAVPALTSDRAVPVVGAAELQAVLDRDLENMLRTGALAPGEGGGIAIGVHKHGRRRVFAYGAATPDSIFEIGSITKTFTGALLARMAQQGKVRLDEPVRKLLPATARIAQPAGPEITLLDLATHHSGLPRMDTGFHSAGPSRPFAGYSEDRLYTFLADHGVEKPADAPFRYSNIGFGLLGHALAIRAGTDYPALVRDLITGPLEMHDTVVVPSPEQARRVLQGHDTAHRPVAAMDLGALAGAGALHSTAGDTLTWLEANLHAKQLEVEGLSAALVSSHRIRANVRTGLGIGLAWPVDLESGVYGHSGTTVGFTADAFLDPKNDTATVVLSNTGPATAVSADVVSEHVRARLAGKPAIDIEELVVPASGGLRGWIRLLAAYWITMLASGVFTFCLVMGVQGIAAQLLPHRYFLRVSSFLQLTAFAIMVSTYFLQPMMVSPGSIVTAQQQGLLASSPSYWFLGLFQALNASPLLAPLAERAGVGLALVVLAAVAAYVLSYLHTFRRIAEESDIAPTSPSLRWLPAFGSPLKTALVQFSIRTLLRSTRHRMILAFYLGLGFAVGIFLLKTPRAHQVSAASSGDAWYDTSLPLLVTSVLMMGFAVLGTRVAFSMPVDLRANWIFRFTPAVGGPHYLAARRWSLGVLSVAPVWTASAVLLLSTWPWRVAVGHLVVLALLGLILVELCLHGTRKIPFTCAYLPGKSVAHVTFWVLIGLLVPLAVKGAGFERDALQDLTSYTTMLAVLAIAWACARWRTSWLAKTEGTEPQFEEERPGQMLTLELWDSRFASAATQSTPEE